MELPHLGKHCNEKTCNQLDFLPMKCDACSQIFCKDHLQYDDHSCSSSYKKKRPSQIQTASVKQTLSSQAQSVDKNQGVVTIPEVTERDELTVQQDTTSPISFFGTSMSRCSRFRPTIRS